MTRAWNESNVARVSSSPASPGTDELDRLFHQLIRNLAQLDPARVHGPVEVAELYERLIPYRTHRKSLGFDSNEDYEMTVLRLLAGERGYALVEPAETRDALAREVAAVNPDPGFFKQFGSATVTFDPGYVRTALGVSGEEELALDATLPAAEPQIEAVAPEGTGDTDAGETAIDDVPFALEDDAAPSVSPRFSSAPCSFCGGELPMGRAVIFCPHCGQNVGVVHCPACGTELDFGWRYCITCGHQMTALG